MNHEDDIQAFEASFMDEKNYFKIDNTVNLREVNLEFQWKIL